MRLALKGPAVSAGALLVAACGTSPSDGSSQNSLPNVAATSIPVATAVPATTESDSYTDPARVVSDVDRSSSTDLLASTQEAALCQKPGVSDEWSFLTLGEVLQLVAEWSRVIGDDSEMTTEMESAAAELEHLAETVVGTQAALVDVQLPLDDNAGGRAVRSVAIDSMTLPALAAAMADPSVDVVMTTRPHDRRDGESVAPYDEVLMVALITDDDVAFAGMCATDVYLNQLEPRHGERLPIAIRQAFGLVGDELVAALEPEQPPVEQPEALPQLLPGLAGNPDDLEGRSEVTVVVNGRVSEEWDQLNAVCLRTESVWGACVGLGGGTISGAVCALPGETVEVWQVAEPGYTTSAMARVAIVTTVDQTPETWYVEVAMSTDGNELDVMSSPRRCDAHPSALDDKSTSVVAMCQQ